MMSRAWALLLLSAIGFAAPTVCAVPPAPPPPAKYNATIRYAIPAPRDQHVLQYDSLVQHLQGLNFGFIPPLEKHPDTDREDRTKNYLQGTIDSRNAPKLLVHPAVRSVLLIPAGPEEFKLPEAPEDPVAVRLELAGNLTPDRQRELSNQTRVLLRELGFNEAVGYDHRGYTGRPYTRIVGTIPKAKIDLLQRDLRNHPAGWLGPIIPREELPSPLANLDPVQVVEVLPDTEAIKVVAVPEPPVPEFLEKVSADLLEMIKAREGERRQVRVQVVFVGEISGDVHDWRRAISEMSPGFFIESQFGQFVTGMIPLDQVKSLASSPFVSVIRLPRVPQVDIDPTVHVKGDNDRALEQAGLKAFHEMGHQGQKVRIGIIDRDFRGWEASVRSRKLPAKTSLVDLTRELDPDIHPAPYTGADNTIGHGTLCAQAAALAAPKAEIVLIRVDVADPHQLFDVARYVQGGRFSNLIEQRNGELLALTARLNARRADLLRERLEVLNDFTDETDLRESHEFLGPLFAWIYSNREWHRQRMIYHEKLEEDQHKRENRFAQFLKDINTLQGIDTIANPFSWNDGFPLGASSPLSRALADMKKGPLWFQAVGNVQGQSWFAPFRNVPGDPVMKFADDNAPLPKGRWTNEVNFLAWQPYLGERTGELPAKVRVHITLQWREAHDPDYYMRPGDEEDYYRHPLVPLRMQVLRQRDPEHKVLAADAFDLVARSSRWPERLEHLPTASTYEQLLETTLEKGGHYAIRIEKPVDTQWVLVPHPSRKTPTFRLLEGLVPTGLRPVGAPTLPAMEKTGELRPRLYIEVLGDIRRKGRVVLADFSTHAGAIGLPADAASVFSVGAASLNNQPEPYSAWGAPAQMELLPRPTLYAYDELELEGGGAFGTSIANAFAAGTAAAMKSSGLSREQMVKWLRQQEGQVLRVLAGKRKL